MDFLSHEDTYLGLTYKQFNSLRIASLACSTLSLFAALITSVTFVYLRLVYRSRADRVSLRCVWVASVSNVVTSILNIAVVLISDASRYCLSSGVALQFFGILGTAFLTTVGINLLIVFVLNIKKTSKHRLQFFYFAFMILYSLGSIAVPTYISRNPCIQPDGHSSCWFDIFYESSRCGDAVWIYHYSFLMFLVIIAFLCSVIATVKLIREQYIKFGKILRREPSHRKHQSAMIARVLLRCVLYPLIPFAANIWGFIAQTLVFIQDLNPPFELAMFGTVFSCLEGVFITLVFFTDPTVSSILSDEQKKLYRRYVEEYQCIKVANLQNHHNDPNMNSNRSSFDTLVRNCDVCQQQQETTTLPVEQEDYDITDQQNDHLLQLQDVFRRDLKSLSSHHHGEEDNHHQRIQEQQQQQQQQQQMRLQPQDYKLIPVRCVSVPPCFRSNSPTAASRYSTCSSPTTSINTSFVYRLSATDPHRLERKSRDGGGEASNPILTYDHPDTSKAYIPYRHPHLASFMHWFLCLVSRNNKQDKSDSNDDRRTLGFEAVVVDNNIRQQQQRRQEQEQEQQPVAISISHERRQQLSDITLHPPTSGEYTVLVPTPPLTPTSSTFSTGQL